MTATAETPADTGTDPAAALTGALLADGWSYTREVHSDPLWHCRIHDLESPDARLHMNVSVYPDGHLTARLSAAALHTGPGPGRTPGWTADLEVPLPIALAAVKAAASDPEPDLDEAAQLARALGQHTAAHLVAATLTAKGWEVETEPEEDRDGRITEIEWVSPDGEHSACWSAKDAFNPGGWIITHQHRDGDQSRAAETYASPCTPPAVIAALALTD